MSHEMKDCCGKCKCKNRTKDHQFVRGDHDCDNSSCPCHIMKPLTDDLEKHGWKVTHEMKGTHSRTDCSDAAVGNVIHADSTGGVCRCSCHQTHEMKHTLMRVGNLLGCSVCKAGDTKVRENPACPGPKTHNTPWREEFAAITYLSDSDPEQFKHILAFIEKVLVDERDIMAQAVEMSKLGWMDEGVQQERNRAAELIKEKWRQIGLQPHFPGGANEGRKNFQMAILADLLAALTEETKK